MHALRSLSAALLAPVLALVFCSCTDRHASPGAASDPIQVQLTSEPVSLDPALAEDGISMQVLGNVMDGLVGHDADGSVRPWLARSWSRSADGLRYEFILRPGLLWSDGAALTAAHVAEGIRRSLDPRTGSKMISLLDPVASVEAGGGTVTVTLKRPAPYLPELMALSSALPVRPDYLSAHGGKWGEDAPVTGPYRIVSHQAEQEIRLEPNPRWWNASAARPLRPILLRIVRDESTAVSLFEQGRLDVLMRVPSLDFPRLKERGVLRVDPFLATYYLSFNARKPPFNDREWRRAVAGAIRRDEIASVLGTGELPARSWIPPGLEGHLPWADPRPLFAGSVRKVREVLSKGRIPPVELGFDTSGRNTTLLEKVQADLRSALGLEVSLRNRDWKSHIRELAADTPAIYRFGWLTPILDPITHLEVFTTGNPNNYSGWSNPSYDRLVREIAAMPAGPARASRIRAAQKILVEDEAAVVPIYHYVQVHAVSPRIANYSVNAFGVTRFCDLSTRPAPAR
jgi:oligopeptide transport system substrate-binding protein